MRRLAVVFLLFIAVVGGSAQTTTQAAPTSDAQALSLAQQSLAALTGGTTISDVTLGANVISILGSDNETGTGTFRAKGISESRVDQILSAGIRSDVRNATTGIPAGAWTINGAAANAYAQHNCWTDAAWFFPALSSLTQFGSPFFLFKYVGPEQYGGVSTQHIQIAQMPAVSDGSLQRLSVMDFYLDASSLLPTAVAYKTHPDSDMDTDIPVEVLFTNYQPVKRIQIPFHFQKMLNGRVVLDVLVTSAAVDTGVVDTAFIIQ
jgi:hypothetical protein